MREVASELAAVVPPGLDPEAFADGCSETEFAEARERLAECARCPPHGGACDTRRLTLMERGERPAWDRERKPTAGLVWSRCERWAEHELREMLGRADVPAPMRGCRFASFAPSTAAQESALRACSTYAERYPELKNLILRGDVGLGKTHLSIAVLAELMSKRKVRSGLFVHTGKFFQLLRRDSGSEELLDRAMHVDMLVFDDVGKQRVSPWVREQTDIVINERWVSGRATIFTTNTDGAQLDEAFGKPAMSRIEANMVSRVLDGDDYRGLA